MTHPSKAFFGYAALSVLLLGCGNKEERRLAELQSHCSSLDVNYNEENVKGCTAFLAEPSLAPPVRAMTLNIRGNTYDALGKYDLAIADYREVVQLMPGIAWGHGNIGLEYLRKGDYKTALEYYDQALKVNPAYTFAMYGRGVALSRLGQIDAAKQQLAAATKADPEIGKVYRDIKMEPSL
jgi:lipoprotein NlpI